MASPNLEPMHKFNFQTKTASIAALLLFCAICFITPVSAQNTGGLKGKVRTRAGVGIGGASVAVRQKGEDLKSVTADDKGFFTISDLEPGFYNMVFDANGYASGVLYNVEVKKKKVSDLGDRLMLSSDQGTQIIVKGSVFFKEGTSVTGAKVELEKINSDGSIQKIGNTMTSVSGEFTFRRPEGAAKFRITAKFNGVTATKDLEVAEAAIYRLAITLDTSRSQK